MEEEQVISDTCRSVPVFSHLNKKDLLPCALLGAFCLYLFKDIIIGRHLLIGDDFIQFYLGMKRFIFDELRLHHSIPYWNPYIFGGMPFWAHFESTIFYPLGLLFWLIPPDKAYGYTMFVHFVLAGVFMYLLARSLGLGRAGGIIAGTVFTCNGFIMALLYLGHMCPIQSYIWLPAVILLLNRALRSSRPYMAASVAGFLWGLQILAGAPQDAFYTFLASLLFFLCQANLFSKRPRESARLLAVPFIIFLVGAGISAIQVLPALEFVNESVRTGLDSYEMVTRGSYPPQGIITTLIPHLFGNYTESNVWVGNMPWSIPQQNLYVGILPLLLLYFLSLGREDNRRVVVFAVILAATALVLSFGHHTPLYKIAYLFPGFDRFRAPSKIIVLWVFSLGLLAGKGMDGLLNMERRRALRRCAVCLSLFMGFLVLDLIFLAEKSALLKAFSFFILPEAIPTKMALATQSIGRGFHCLTLLGLLIISVVLLMKRRLLGPKLGFSALLLLLLVDLGYMSAGTVRPDHSIYPTIEKIKVGLDNTIGKDKEIFRVGSYRFNFGPNLEMYLGYQTVNGFTALFPQRYYEYINAYAEQRLPKGWQNFTYGKTQNKIFMDLLNVKYEISHTTQSYALRESFLPRGFMVTDYQILDKEKLLDFMTRPSFDPKKTLLFEKDGLLERPPRYPARRGNASGSVELTLYRPDAMVIETQTNEPGYLFVSEIFYPGWKALVDGKPVPILRGNYLFRVIELPRGTHSVQFYYAPLTIKVGIAISVLTLALMTYIALSWFRRSNWLWRR
ncbi:MAG: YfhO family protein [Desulfobacterales bacterium]|nr:YfhO family protein [Desulfobacterales bacterium]